jgi:hypothetical protein
MILGTSHSPSRLPRSYQFYMNISESYQQRGISAWRLALLFALALLPRVTGLITFENVDEVWGASVRVLTGDLTGGTSQTLPLIHYLYAASYVLLYAIGRLVGAWHGTADFRAQYFHDPTPFIFAGRFVSACLGALSAPLSALIARRLGLSRSSSLIVGGLVALFPMNVWVSHNGKADSGVAVGVLLLAWSILRKLDDPESKSDDVMVGVALAVAVSFKQTALLVVAPCLVGLMALLRWDCNLPWPRIARGLLVTSVASILAWVPMNIGILLDIKGFLDWQRLTLISVESGGSATAYQIAKTAFRTLAKSIDGLTAAGLMTWLFSPFVRRDRKFAMLWGSSAFAYVAVNVASPVPEQFARYYLPYNELAFTLGCVAALSLVEREGRSRAVGLFLTAAVLACSGAGSIEVVRQAMTTPMAARCSRVIEAIAHPERDKILAGRLYMLGVPVSAEAAHEDRERHQRLAKKYGVTLLETPKERIYQHDNRTGGYYVRAIPYGIGGDESVASSPVGRMKMVKPFWWPIQYEEWDLDYWTARGFDIFMVTGEGRGFITDQPYYRSFHEQIRERCELVAVLPTTRSLFGEMEVKIYRLRRPMARRTD